LRRRTAAIVGASIIMAIALVGLSHILAPWFARGILERVGALVLLVAWGLGVFAVFAHFLGAARLDDLRKVLGRGAPDRG
jgi:peptidoglycan biosynthesis protein MviN/MurJ (putative lipid II flippase)